MAKKSGFLTIYSIDGNEIYGEFADAVWTTETTDGGKNNVFTGFPSEGTLETFLQLNDAFVSHVNYTFECEGETFSGRAQLLAPIDPDTPTHAAIRIETGDTPAQNEHLVG